MHESYCKDNSNLNDLDSKHLKWVKDACVDFFFSFSIQSLGYSYQKL